MKKGDRVRSGGMIPGFTKRDRGTIEHVLQDDWVRVHWDNSWGSTIPAAYLHPLSDLEHIEEVLND